VFLYSSKYVLALGKRDLMADRLIKGKKLERKQPPKPVEREKPSVLGHFTNLQLQNLTTSTEDPTEQRFRNEEFINHQTESDVIQSSSFHLPVLLRFAIFITSELP
jgi:hypothetical protein